MAAKQKPTKEQKAYGKARAGGQGAYKITAKEVKRTAKGVAKAAGLAATVVGPGKAVKAVKVVKAAQAAKKAKAAQAANKAIIARSATTSGAGAKNLALSKAKAKLPELEKQLKDSQAQLQKMIERRDAIPLKDTGAQRLAQRQVDNLLARVKNDETAYRTARTKYRDLKSDW